MSKIPSHGTSASGHSQPLMVASQANTHMSLVALQESTVQGLLSSHARGAAAGMQPNSAAHVSGPLQKLPS